jgi:hypothetical protein
MRSVAQAVNESTPITSAANMICKDFIAACPA